MLSKRGRAYDPDSLPPAARLRHNISDLFLSTDISASRAQELLQDAGASGSAHVGDMQRLGGAKNVNRNLLRKLLKGSKWPKVYYASVPVHNEKTGLTESRMIPMILPHELLGALKKHASSMENLFSRSGMDELTSTHLLEAASKCGIGTDNLLGMGLWLDGVVAKWDRSQTMEFITATFPGCTHSEHLQNSEQF